MRPVAIFQHASSEGPGHFATYLDAHSLPWRIIRTDVDKLPATTRDFSGIAVMGGPMSANDELPWIPCVLDTIREAMAADIPVIGHCLGGQLMSRALGGTVSRNPVKEIGWGDVAVADNAEAGRWFGDGLRGFTTFQWHGDTFSIPPGATAVLSSPHCANQAFVVGRHLGLQCHVEMNRAMVESWCASGAREISESAGPAVQSAEEIRRDLDQRLARLHDIADRLYARWAAGLLR